MSGETARDPRRSTFVKVHVRSDAGWSEAVVCNVSAHGMMLRGDGLPKRCSFVEISSGKVAFAGQVRWSLAGRCGVRTREVVNIAALLGEAGGEDDAAPPAGQVERYSLGPRSRTATDNQALARTLDFVLVLAFMVAGAWLIGTTVTGILGSPLQRVATELAPPRQ